MFKFKLDFYLKLVFIISLVTIILAYFIEYVLGYQPCNLCLLERIPYGLSMILILANYIFIKNDKFIILLLILLFAFSLTISFYHFGIEQGFFEESAVCGVNNSAEILSKEELLKQLQKKTISCKDVTFKIFGLSLTTFNIVLSLIIFCMLVKIFKNYEKFKN